MKLREALELGEACGLQTVGEALDNVVLHALNLFVYKKINEEIEELHSEFQKSGFKPEDSIRHCLQKLA